MAFLSVQKWKILVIMGTCALPDIYTLALGPAALGLVCTYQAKHLCPWYNYYILYQFINVP